MVNGKLLKYDKKLKTVKCIRTVPITPQMQNFQIKSNNFKNGLQRQVLQGNLMDRPYQTKKLINTL